VHAGALIAPCQPWLTAPTATRVPFLSNTAFAGSQFFKQMRASIGIVAFALNFPDYA